MNKFISILLMTVCSTALFAEETLSNEKDHLDGDIAYNFLNASNVIRGDVSILVLDHINAVKQYTTIAIPQIAPTAINISISSP